ncbi:DNA adenine methylase [Mucilaginibacter sp.]|uniref:DNA adenine methylase n=1 Tax=Mucilaginibacter sp. TaxID=1882438 RepID=UPI0032657083
MIINLKEFPVTRYQGSKRKMISWIFDVLNELDLSFETVLDGFGGTASVSYLFKKMGKNVTYNDSLKFNYLIGKTLIENNDVRLYPNELETLVNFNSISNIVEKNFQGIYYTDNENKWIDNVAENINNRFGAGSPSFDEYKYAMSFYALFQACLIKRPFNLFHRKNLNLRLNDVKRNFGNKTSWEKPFDELFKKFIEEANTTAFDNQKKCLSLNLSVFDLNSDGYDLVYFDPPYFVKKDDHETSDYFKCYHFLEGLANYNNWERMINYETINRRLIYQLPEPSLNRHNISEKLEELLYKFRKSTIILSYKEGGIPSIDYIIEILNKLGKKVISKSIHYKYALNHQNGDAQKNREVLIIGI